MRYLGINDKIREEETYGLQLLIKAFNMWSTELQKSREEVCEGVCFWKDAVCAKVIVFTFSIIQEF